MTLTLLSMDFVSVNVYVREERKVLSLLKYLANTFIVENPPLFHYITSGHLV